MANVPTPDVAKGVNVGAKQDRSRDEFHAGPYLDVNDYSSIKEAMQDSAAGNGVAYIPSGTSIDIGNYVLIDSSLNGATLVGDGADSVIRLGDWVGAYLQDKGSAIRNVTIANLRIDANGRKYGINKIDNGHDDENLLIDNVWVHDADKAGLRVDGPGLTVRNVSVWGSNDYHGIGGWNNPPNDSPRSKLVRCLAWDNTGYGIDASEGSWLIDKCLVTQNGENGKSGGMKTSTNTNHTTIRDTVSINNRHRGFQMTGAAENLEVENFLVRDNAEHGVVFSNPSNVNVGTLYTVNNGKSNVFIYDDVTIEAERIEACGAANKGIQMESGSGGSGYIDTVVASGNDSTNVESGNIEIGTVEQTSCSVPNVEDVLSSASPTVRYRGADGWQDATVKFYDGEQFTDASVSRIGSN